MYVELRQRVWVVDGDLAQEVADRVGPDAEALDREEFRRRLDAGDRPDALLLDAGTLHALDGQRLALDGIVRLVIATDGADGIPADLLSRPSVRTVPRTLSGDTVDRSIRWLTGVDDEAVADAEVIG
jgi:hypothetical protein